MKIETIRKELEAFEAECEKVKSEYAEQIGNKLKWKSGGLDKLRAINEKSNPLKMLLQKKEGKANYDEIIKKGIICPLCQEDIIDEEIIETSSALMACKIGELTLEKAKELMLNAHIRHAHTDYDEIISNESEKVAKLKGMNYEVRQEMFQEAKKEARRKIHGWKKISSKIQ